MTSTAPSTRYPAGCPTCGADVGQPCRSLRTRRVTDTHKARIGASYPSRVAGANDGEARS